MDACIGSKIFYHIYESHPDEHKKGLKLRLTADNSSIHLHDLEISR